MANSNETQDYLLPQKSSPNELSNNFNNLNVTSSSNAIAPSTSQTANSSSSILPTQLLETSIKKTNTVQTNEDSNGDGNLIFETNDSIFDLNFIQFKYLYFKEYLDPSVSCVEELTASKIINKLNNLSPSNNSGGPLINLSFNQQEELVQGTRVNSNGTVSNIQPPLFPPPLPPPFSGNIPSTLTPPVLPPPPPPTNTTPPIVSSVPLNIFQFGNSNTNIIKLNEENSISNLITLKIENAQLLEHLTMNYGFDRAKLACALLVANNDIKQAVEILQKLKKN